jgi:hypothetical protein
MSQENVDLVLSLQSDTDEDLAQVFRDDETGRRGLKPAARSCTRSVSLPFQACSVAERPIPVLRA